MVLSRLSDGSCVGWLQTKRGMHSIYFQSPASVSSSAASAAASTVFDTSMIRLDEELVDIIQSRKVVEMENARSSIHPEAWSRRRGV